MKIFNKTGFLIRNVSVLIMVAGLLLVFVAAGLSFSQVSAGEAEANAAQIMPLHPTFPLLDENGVNVLESGGAISTMQTCGACHNADFITEHSYHVSLGLDEYTNPGTLENGREWDTSTGLFGKWNALTYRYLSPDGDEVVDLTTPEWIMTLGRRHVGGGPAVYSRDGSTLLTELDYAPDDLQTNIVDPETGELIAWDWEESGVVEMNCFLCHIPEPNNDARIQTLESGEFRWANTATLLDTGIVEGEPGNLQYVAGAFQEDGELQTEFITVQDPQANNCGLCHGLVHDTLEEPLVTAGCIPERWTTETTGQIISPQRLKDTGMNIENKDELDRAWDIHSERLLSCTDCHYSLNNPVYYVEDDDRRPEHLTFDPRRLEIGEYLYQPIHDFARGQSAQSTVASELKDSMRRCESCHATEETHTWLPYKDRHMESVSCESCHIPQLYSTTFQQYDWTVIKTDGSAETQCRGIEGETGSTASLITGYTPVLLPRQNIEGDVKLVPHNLVTSWFWIYGEEARPVPQADLMAVYLDGENYAADIVAAFDADGNGTLDEIELVIDTDAKEGFVAGKLAELGLENPRISAEVQPYSINHNVINDEWAISDCQECHGDQSRITQPILLASYMPGGVMPEFVRDANVLQTGEIVQQDDGSLYYQPASDEQGLYILGHDNVRWVDYFGIFAFLGVLVGITAHGGLRFFASLKQPRHETKVEKVYMYGVYERLWHWLQTTVIMILLFTGLVIHKPDMLGFLSFRSMVLVHNIMAAILVINAALSLFYHLVSGEIQQFIPRPRGFFDQMISQTKYYIQGIFRGAEHPFEKTPESKLNPLQQITYFGILNVLLPLQVITGALMWGAQRWPEIANALGGLPFLAPFHTLIAWTFAAFIVMHVYLTTTGHKPMAGIQSMISGWDEVEVHTPAEEVSEA